MKVKKGVRDKRLKLGLGHKIKNKEVKKVGNSKKVFINIGMSKGKGRGIRGEVMEVTREERDLIKWIREEGGMVKWGDMRGSFVFRRHIRVAGDVLGGIVLSQIVYGYWFGGEEGVGLTLQDLADKNGMILGEVKGVVANLERRGLVTYCNQDCYQSIGSVRVKPNDDAIYGYWGDAVEETVEETVEEAVEGV